MQVPTANALEKFISDFILDAARRCFKYAVELEHKRIPVWTGAAQASTQSGPFGIFFPISPRAKKSGIAYGIFRGKYDLRISGDGDLVESWNSNLNYFDYLDTNSGRSTTAPWGYVKHMWKKYEERFDFIIETEYEDKYINFMRSG